MPMSPRLLRPLASGAFNPKSIAGLALWLDASVTSSLTFNGAAVSQWRDLSGNERHYSQATAANQPSGTTRTQNGRRVLDFGGAGRLVGNAAALALARNIGGATILVVAKHDVTENPIGQAARYLMVQSRGDSVTSARLAIGTANFVTPSNGFTFFGRRNDGDTFAPVVATSDTDPHVFTGLADYQNTSASLFVDGANAATDSSWLTSGNTPDTNSLASSIGFGGATADHLDGFIGELLFFQRALTDQERQRVERALGRKWGITVA